MTPESDTTAKADGMSTETARQQSSLEAALSDVAVSLCIMGITAGATLSFGLVLGLSHDGLSYVALLAGIVAYGTHRLSTKLN